MDMILSLLEKNARLTPREIGVMLGMNEADVAAKISEYEKSGVILGYGALINWDKTDREYVTAMIELKITPQRELGFDRVAERIYNYPEVQSLYLVSGGFDLCVVIEGKTMREVAFFVAEKLAQRVLRAASVFIYFHLFLLSSLRYPRYFLLFLARTGSRNRGIRF